MNVMSKNKKLLRLKKKFEETFFLKSKKNHKFY